MDYYLFYECHSKMLAVLTTNFVTKKFDELSLNDDI